jgi:hypothetical protein
MLYVAKPEDLAGAKEVSHSAEALHYRPQVDVG